MEKIEDILEQEEKVLNINGLTFIVTKEKERITITTDWFYLLFVIYEEKDLDLDTFFEEMCNLKTIEEFVNHIRKSSQYKYTLEVYENKTEDKDLIKISPEKTEYYLNNYLFVIDDMGN